jgi:hypothetical protein
MSNIGALIFAVVAAAIVWFVSPQVEPNIGEAWLVGTGGVEATFHGREIVTAVIGLAVWIAGLHIARA